MRRRRKVIPMPTEEEKQRAKLKLNGSDPLVWAMKSVDDKFPDSREKTAETVRAENEVEMKMGPATMEPEDKVEVKPQGVGEIKAEGKTAMPVDDGVLTVEVAPMRQNVDGVSEEELKQKMVNKVAQREHEEETAEAENSAKKKLIDKVRTKATKANQANEHSDGHRTQVKLTALESKQKKMTFAFAALVILALGGMTFGVVAMINQNNTAKELTEQIAASANNGAEGEQTDGEYVYLKDWGVKIKIPDNLTSVSFDMDVEDYSEALIWGVRKDSGSNYTPDFAKQSKNEDAMGMMTRIPRYERMSAGRLIWYDDYYNYYYKGPSGEPKVDEAEMSWWVESYLLIKEMLTNADNYTRIDDMIGQQ